MIGAFIWIKNLFRKTSLIYLKVALFSAVCGGVFLNFNLKIDFHNGFIDYENGNTSIIVILLLLITSFLFIFFDFWIENSRSKQLKRYDLISLIENEDVSEKLKQQAMDILKNMK